MHDALLACQPEGAKHNADICPFCVEKASQSTASGTSPGSAGPDVSDHLSTEGGANPTMSDDKSNMISQETHEALVQTKVAEAVKQSDAALATMTEKAQADAARADKAEAELATVKTENAELNSKLDEAAVNLKTATEKAESLEKEATEAAAKREVEAKASERASQVKNLGLFEETYIAEKAEAWAKKSDDDWAEQVESWKKLKTPTGTEAASTTDAASAMTGTTESLTATGDSSTDSAAGGDDKTPARRKVLGLA